MVKHFVNLIRYHWLQLGFLTWFTQGHMSNTSMKSATLKNTQKMFIKLHGVICDPKQNSQWHNPWSLFLYWLFQQICILYMKESHILDLDTLNLAYDKNTFTLTIMTRSLFRILCFYLKWGLEVNMRHIFTWC